MGDPDVRWKQRFSSFLKAFEALHEAVLLTRERELTRLEKQGLIKAFEFTYEMAWNVLKDFLEYQGVSGATGARDTFREALARGLISDGSKWMEMIPSRNATVHIYDDQIAEEIYQNILVDYYPLFQYLKELLSEKAKDEETPC